jgi:DNA polymerase III delta prime subunit
MALCNDEFLWVEKYRPNTIEDCILPASLKETFGQFVNLKEIPNLLLVGPQGLGKTTVARALCNEVGCETLFINGSSENGIDVFRNKITNYASTVSFSGGRKVVIIDESDYMNANSLQPALRSGIEAFSHNTTFILTANYPSKIIAPIHSRCAVVDFKIKKEDKKVLISSFFKRVCTILEKENVEYNKDVIATLVKKYFPDFRRIINELQRYSVNGSIDVGILSLVNDIQLKDLLKFLREKDFGNIRTWVNSNIDGDISSLYTKLYSGLYNFLEPKSIPIAILLLAKYQYQTSFVTDQEIQFMAFLVELMGECSFKSIEIER